MPIDFAEEDKQRAQQREQQFAALTSSFDVDQILDTVTYHLKKNFTIHENLKYILIHDTSITNAITHRAHNELMMAINLLAQRGWHCLSISGGMSTALVGKQNVLYALLERRT